MNAKDPGTPFLPIKINMPRRLFFSFLLLASLLPASGQWYNPDKVNSKFQTTYGRAIDLLTEGEFATGKQMLHALLQKDARFVDAWLSLAGACGQLKQYDSAANYYGRAFALDSQYSADMRLAYSINLAGSGRFEEAKEQVERFLGDETLDPRSRKAGEYRLSTYRFAVEHQAKTRRPAEGFKPFNLGDSINSPRSEYYPSFTIDGTQLVFTRRGDGIREDFFAAEKKEKGYTRSAPLAGTLNQRAAKGGITISQDGELLVFAGNFPEEGEGDFDLYICYATPQGWSEPFNLGRKVNTEFWESSPSLSPDKRFLYFSSNRPGGYGGKDLYAAERLPNGSWGNVTNLGPNFNTSADELAPFIHADNQTLYFTSGGHPGYGGSDIYLSRRGPGGVWSIPYNLGYPINTIDDDGSLFIAADGQTAFFASVRPDTRGGLDLYQFDMPADIRPLRTLWVKGTVTDAKTGQTLPSSIELKQASSGEALQQVMTDETGNYLVTLPVGNEYFFSVNRKGYLYYTNRFAMNSEIADSVYVNNIALQPIALNTALELKNILFETNSFVLSNESFLELDKLVQLLNENPGLRVQIVGHTDNLGKAADNLNLSANRAKAVVDYLIAKGIDRTRLSSKGMGQTQPVAANDTEAGRAKNRRTELLITGI
jgi:outer membrane protein OmpA-like peptidoglycan-associated protein/tetratricopeptide (TPR) repeat protein